MVEVLGNIEGGSRIPTKHSWMVLRELDGLVDTAGGFCIPMTAGATLKVGDLVYHSAAHTVNKSTTAGDYSTKFAGVVVGGASLYDSIMQGDIDVGETAATVGQEVLVCVLGKCKIVSGAAIVAGASLSGDTGVAGKALTTTAGRVLALEAAAAADVKILGLVSALTSAVTGLAIGTNVQAWSAKLDTLSGAATALTGDYSDGTVLAALVAILVAKGIITDSTTA